MDLGTRTEVVFGVGEEVVRAGSNKVRAADFRVRDSELGIATLGTGTNELVRYKSFVVSLHQGIPIVLDGAVAPFDVQGYPYSPPMSCSSNFRCSAAILNAFLSNREKAQHKRESFA